MSDVSHYRNDGSPRLLRSEEKEIIKRMTNCYDDAYIDSLRVVDANDGGMGSVRFESNLLDRQVFGKEICRFTYVDVDNIPVSITINIDKNGNIFELDFWKVDFSPIISYPKSHQIINDAK